MKIKKRRIGGLLVLVLILSSVAPGITRSGEDHDRVKALKEAGEIVPLEAIIEKARANRPGRVLEAELETEHGRLLYELEFLDDQGVVWELEYDARTGELLEIEQEGAGEHER
ncbi:MAG TPA: PepSY domain-containing protein [Nitrospiria bacterium]|nr:PepSY domain-containing protein [Nitrospiria bacterium]